MKICKRKIENWVCLVDPFARRPPPTSGRPRACVLMAKRALQTDSMRRFHALHQPSPLPTAADASLLAKRIYLQWRKAARVGSRIVRSVMSSLPLQAVYERKRLLKFCDEQWFKFMPDPSSASWPD